MMESGDGADLADITSNIVHMFCSETHHKTPSRSWWHPSLMVKNEGSGSKPSRGCGWKLSLVNPADALDPMNHFEPIFTGH